MRKKKSQQIMLLETPRGGGVRRNGESRRENAE